jgi:hypothetical protein
LLPLSLSPLPLLPPPCSRCRFNEMRWEGMELDVLDLYSQDLSSPRFVSQEFPVSGGLVPAFRTYALIHLPYYIACSQPGSAFLYTYHIRSSISYLFVPESP